MSVPASAQTVALRGPGRDFGYLVGDVIVTQATVTSPAGNALDWRSVPVPGPLNASIELRHVDVQETLGDGVRKTVLRLEYQSFFAPDHVMLAELPGYDIRFGNGVAHVPAWPFHVSPLRVAQNSVDDLADLHGNLSVPADSDATAFTSLLASLAVALAAGCVFAGVQGWLPGIGRKTRPFAGAARRIARLAPSEVDAALREMLRAFDATAGRHVFAAEAEDFLRRHEGFSGLHAEVTRFFAMSDRHFFAPAQAGGAEDFAEIIALARALRRAERRW